MGNSKKKANTAANPSKTSTKKLQAKKSQTVQHTYKWKQVKDEDNKSESEESSNNLPYCKLRQKRAKHATNDDISVVDVDDVESQYVSDNNEASSNEVRA